MKTTLIKIERKVILIKYFCPYCKLEKGEYVFAHKINDTVKRPRTCDKTGMQYKLVINKD